MKLSGKYVADEFAGVWLFQLTMFESSSIESATLRALSIDFIAGLSDE
jgi:hypothetical protein